MRLEQWTRRWNADEGAQVATCLLDGRLQRCRVRNLLSETLHIDPVSRLKELKGGSRIFSGLGTYLQAHTYLRHRSQWAAAFED